MTKRAVTGLLPTFALFLLFAGIAVPQTFSPTPRPHQNFVDQSGNACNACSLYSYLAGTTTPTPTYTDSTGGAQNPNPIVLDAAGGANIWLASGVTYKFILCEGPTVNCLTAGGATQWTVDQVQGGGFLSLSGGVLSGAISFVGGSGGTPATTTLANLGGLSSILTSLQTMAGPLSTTAITAPLINSLQADEYHTTSMNGPLLSNYWRYLHAAPVYQGTYPSGGMDAIVLGDSLWEGDQINSQGGPLGCGPNTAVPQYSQNRQAEQIRIALQAQYGYGGTGIQPVFNVMGCALVNPELYTASPTSVTVSTLIGPQYSTNGSVAQMSTGQVFTWNGGGLPYTFVRTYCADNSGSNPITVAIDGNAVGTACGTHNSSAIARVATSTPNQPYTNHSATFTCATGPCYLYGVEGRPSTGGGNAGVRVHNLSVGSAPSGWWVGHTDFEDLITDGFITPSAQLVIYPMGTNDASLSIGVPTYTSNFEATFAHELAKAGEPPVIVIYRPGLDTIASQTYFAALTAYGYANNLLVIDQTNRWGTSCTTGCWWLGNDNIHMNDGANLDSSHTILNALTDVMHGQPISPLAGDTGLNAGIYRVTAPPFSGSVTQPPGYVWDGIPGIPAMKGFYGWGTGNPSSLAGTIGFSDPTYLGLIYGANGNNDFCVHVPTSGGNFLTCAGANFRVNKSTGATTTKNNTPDDGLGNSTTLLNQSAAGFANSQGIAVTTLAAAGSGGSFSAFVCSAGWACSPNQGSITGTMGTAPTSGDLVKIAWTTAFTHKVMCILNVVDQTSNVTLTSFVADTGNSSTTQSEFYSFSAPTAAHQLVIQYVCN